MANLQELMLMVTAPRPTQTKFFRVTITPERGDTVYLRIRAHTAGHARIRAAAIAKKRRFVRFSFTVRPE